MNSNKKCGKYRHSISPIPQHHKIYPIEDIMTNIEIINEEFT
jgi:hypothetical protein